MSKAQRINPDFWLVRDPDQDDPFLVDNKETLELYLQNGYVLEEKLYKESSLNNL